MAQIHRKVPLVTMGRPIFAPKITTSRGAILKPNYLPHPWTHPTYHTSISDPPFSTVHWTDRQTDTHTYGQTNRWLTGMVCNYRPLSLYKERRGLITNCIFDR